MSPRYVAVTGACGFIGKHVTRKLLERGDYVYGIDALTYAADPGFVTGIQCDYPERFNFVCRDIRDLGRFPDVDACIHLGAETHVDNSINGESARFVGTNVVGTVRLLEMTLALAQHGMPHFLYVSTDEVYGEVLEGKAHVADPLRPRSPYAASKASADLLVQAYGTTYGLPYTIVRPTNCYGSTQYPEKLIPKAIRCLRMGKPIPIHGDGSQTRCWLWVEDCADAILYALDHADTLPPILNIGGNAEERVRDVVERLCDLMDADPVASIAFGYERPGCDQRYAVDDSALRVHGWTPKGELWRDLPGIVEAERSSAWRF